MFNFYFYLYIWIISRLRWDQIINTSTSNSIQNMRKNMYFYLYIWIIFRVYRAKGLVAADMGGTSDPYCVLELDNARVRSTHIRMICLHQRKPPKMVSFPSNQLNVHVYVSNFEVATHTEYKTLEPVWHRVFELQAFK